MAARRDLHSHIKVLTSESAVRSADRNAQADLYGFQSAEVLLHIGVGGITFTATNHINFFLQDSDDDSSYANVDGAYILGRDTSLSTGRVHEVKAAHAATTHHRFGYTGDKRYLRLRADFGGTHGTGTMLSVMILGGNALLEAVPDQQ